MSIHNTPGNKSHQAPLGQNPSDHEVANKASKGRANNNDKAAAKKHSSKDGWAAAKAVGSLQKAASTLFSGLKKPDAMVSNANPSKMEAVSAIQTSVDEEVDKKNDTVHRAIHKQLAIATELQANGNFHEALNLVKGIVEISAKYQVNLKELIHSYPLSITASSILLEDTKTYHYLVSNNLAWVKIDSPDELIATIHFKAIENTKRLLNAGSPSYLEQIFPKDGPHRTGNYDLPAATRAVAAALIATKDKDFLVNVIGNLNSAAKLALMMGDCGLARSILTSMGSIDRDLTKPLPHELLPPPAYTPR